jgi:hypothetical protein
VALFIKQGEDIYHSKIKKAKTSNNMEQREYSIL